MSGKNDIFFIGKTANIELVDDSQFLTLNENNNTLVIEQLIQEGQNIQVQNTDGITPLIFACRNNNTRVAELLLELTELLLEL